jgi:hypothetical protein
VSFNETICEGEDDEDDVLVLMVAEQHSMSGIEDFE